MTPSHPHHDVRLGDHSDLGAGRARAYAVAATVVGLALLFWIASREGAALVHQPGMLWVFAVGFLVGELWPITVRRGTAETEISPARTFAFALVLVAGPAAILVHVPVSILADALRRRPPVHIVLRAAHSSLALGAAAALLALAGVPDARALPTFAPGDLPVILLAGAVFFATDAVLVATAVALAGDHRLWPHLSRDFVLQASSSGFLLGLSPIVVVAGDFSVLLLPLLGLPLLSIVQGQREAAANEHHALHDALTGLPNRVLLRERLEQATRIAQHEGSLAAVLLLDLDGFKEVNDTMGHHAGDLVLREVAERLAGTARTGDTIARLGGDEFAVLAPRLRAEPDATALARRLVRVVAEPMDIAGASVEVGASIGIALFPQHGDDERTLLEHADLAMYSAKRRRAGWEVFCGTSDRRRPRRLELAGELRRALEDNELTAHYQPKVDVATGEVVGVEALMRWEDAERGWVPPAEFVPVAEQTGLIGPATLAMVDAALARRRVWAAEGVELGVAVNLSPRTLVDRRLHTELLAKLHRWECPPEALTLEITEAMLMSDPDGAEQLLHDLKALGVQLSIDDFGTGYSSLDRLRRLPVDEVKIDRSFVMEMATNRSDAVIVRSTIGLARNLGLRVVAEGVEHAAVLRELAGLGCDQAQGFLISRALSPEAVVPFVAGRRAAAQLPLERAA